MKQLDNKKPQNNGSEAADTEPELETAPKKKRSLFPYLLLLILLGLAAGGGYLGWQEFTRFQSTMLNRFSELQGQIDQRVTSTQVESRIRPLQQSVSRSDGRLAELERGQRDLLTSTEKLYELYGRDENGWKLAEVAYLMSIAQHKLILENDFAGAAKTLDAASQLIGELADPGLLPVRVKISEEIAMLKTRARPDLVGMTLLLARLAHQITTFTPGYQAKPDKAAMPMPASGQSSPADPNQPLDEKIVDFVKSLVTIKNSPIQPKREPQVVILDVGERLEDNLKLTRWSVLERDAIQYEKLMAENVAMFKQYYDLENAAHADFFDALVKLEKSAIKPDLPDIGGSLVLLRKIIKKREASPEPEQQEVSNG